MITSKIKELRISKNLTQDELALKCGITTRTIQNLEKQPNKNIVSLIKIKKALDCKSLDDLFYDD